MAKIDVSKIEGYAEMSDAEKLAALESYDMDLSGYVLKSALDKATSEAAGYKKQLREHMSAEEAQKADNDATLAEMKAELESLRAEKNISEYATQFVGIGYSSELAHATAVAMQKGDVATMFKNHALFVAEHEKALKAKLLKDTPTPPAGEGSKTITRDDIKKMSLDEKMDFYDKNPELFKKLTGDD